MKTCLDCGIPIRASGTPAQKAPSTVIGIRGRCKTHHRHHLGLTRGTTPVIVEPGDPCRGCGTPLRPRGSTAADHPETLLHYTKGRCWTCAIKGDDAGREGARQRAEKRHQTAENRRAAAKQARMARLIDNKPITIAGHTDPDPRIRSLASQAQGFLDARRRRGVPPQGTGAHETDTEEGAA